MQTCIALCHEATPPSLLGCDQFEWNGSGGAIIEVWRCSNCCGSNGLNLKGAIFCLVHWIPLLPCSHAHLFSESAGQGCTIVPHCAFAWFCAPLAFPCTRYNLRKKSNTRGSICGDVVCSYVCFPCACLQHCRAAQINEWALWPIPSPRVVGSCQLLHNAGLGLGGAEGTSLTSLML